MTAFTTPPSRALWTESPRLRLDCDSDAAFYYDHLGTQGIARSQSGMPVVNMGYWRDVAADHPDPFGAASEALFDLVDDFGELGPLTDLVVDAGCGFGTHAVHCARRFPTTRVLGLNVSTLQLDYARGLAMRRGVAEQVRFARANVCAIPLPNEAADAVLAIEAAFHFHPRQTFFREALRVLRPGGTLALADILLRPPRNPAEELVLQGLCHSVQIPRANVGLIDGYLAELRAAGFTRIEWRSIYADVFPPFRRWFLRQLDRAMLRYNPLFSLASMGYLFYPMEYILLRARRPH